MKNKNVIEKGMQYLFNSARHVNVECNLHMHAAMEIILVSEGTLTMFVGGKKYDVSKGQGIFVPPFEPHAFHSGTPNHCHVMIFSRELMPHFFDILKSNVPKRHIFAVSPMAYDLSEEILSRRNNSVGYIDAQAVLAPLCREIYYQCNFEKKKVPADNSLTEAMEYMEAHFEKDINLEKVAKVVGRHPVTLSKAFSKQTGVHFNFYLQYIRCSHAAHLIKSSDLSFTEVAYTVGFGSVRSFNRAFVSIYGLTPSQYKTSEAI